VGATAAEEAGAGGAAGELLVTGGSIVAAAGSVLLVCLTVSAAVDGAETPIDIADEFYGTHFGDVSGWVRGQHSVTKDPKTRTGLTSTPLAPPSASPTSEPDAKTRKNLGRIYVTYTKLNKRTHRYYAGRTSMVVDLTKSLDEQALLAVMMQLIDSLGGAWSDTGKPYRTENAIRSVAKDNPWGRRFHDAATGRWGQGHFYTGC
jgi:hypothetical protein